MNRKLVSHKRMGIIGFKHNIHVYWMRIEQAYKAGLTDPKRNWNARQRKKQVDDVRRAQRIAKEMLAFVQCQT